MSRERFFRLSIWSPVFVPLIALAFSAMEAGLGIELELGPIRSLLLMSTLVGGVPYVVFATIGAWLYRRAPAQRLRTASLYAPLAFGGFLFFIASLFSFPELGQYGLEQPLLLGLYYGVWAIAVGYAYVGLVHLTLFAFLKTGLIA